MLDERLRHRLKVQSLQIASVMARYHLPAEIIRSAAGARWTHFELSLPATEGLPLPLLERELLAALRVPEVKVVEQRPGRLRVSVRQPRRLPVDLMDLMERLEPPPLSAVLGLAEGGRPLLLNLLSSEVANLLVAGQAGAGKTTLLRTLALSLAARNKQSRVQFVIANGVPEESGALGEYRPVDNLLPPLNYLPHLLAPMVETVEGAAATFSFLLEEVRYRAEQRVTWPLIVILVDNLDALAEGGSPVLEPLQALLQTGPAVGFRLVLSVRDATGAALQPLLKSNVTIRLVGQVTDAEEARAAAGAPDSLAQYLLGQGDFLAVTGQRVTHFQAATVSDYDLHLALEKLHRQSRPVMVARPVTVRLHLPPGP
ncbi:MAG: NACHT domain-containing protein [Chloroflexi bacterium]|nr:NACHT domain-containing protein [Chloroflexota bacterium]MCI0579899.1 NACHT domain-containing protein [Chloroflexota bacterium]MCI0646180.1 NACHT domain-containing protein [Chloroflexota bacterium]MCI0729890.1 NACHT domain-containing protein [Chloroflexota bacterium]